MSEISYKDYIQSITDEVIRYLTKHKLEPEEVAELYEGKLLFESRELHEAYEEYVNGCEI